MEKFRFLLPVVLVAFLAFGLCSCEKTATAEKEKSSKEESGKKEKEEKPSQAELWNKAGEKGTIKAYDAYMTLYPDGPHAEEAVDKLVELWGEKVKELSPEDMKELKAVIETNRGIIKFRFFPEDAPDHCRNFIRLAMSHFYDGLIFHRVIDGFMIQGGCPDGTGTGGPGYTIDAEFNDRPHKPGTVSMARSRNPNSAGSQFFICLVRKPQLDGSYTVFGQVTEGMNVVKKIGKVETGRRNRPVQEQIMEKVYIEGL